MNRWFSALITLAAAMLAGCERRESTPPAASGPSTPRSLIEARQRFTTRLQRQEKINEPVPVPPPNLFRSVSYSSPAGELAAYVGVSPGKERKHPAIIWIVGGFANSISEIAWTPGPPENDQSATTFREAGIVMMYPSLRGGNRNPGYLEGFYGEVDDVLAAAEFLAKLDYVNPERIYLGGHSTGGTLALLAAECSDRFRAVFAFGPVSNVAGYGQDVLPFSVLDRDEVNLRSPGKWLANIRTPTFVFEGTRRSNIGELRLMSRTARNPQIHFHPLQGADHFSGLGPVSRLIARKILADEGPSCGIAFTPEELAQALRP